MSRSILTAVAFGMLSTSVGWAQQPRIRGDLRPEEGVRQERPVQPRGESRLRAGLPSGPRGPDGAVCRDGSCALGDRGLVAPRTRRSRFPAREAGFRAVTDAPPQIRWMTDPQRAAANARRSGKPLLIQVTAEWCGYCRQMKRETFAASSVRRRVAESYLPLTIDADRRRALVQRIGIDALPTTLIVAPDMRVLRVLRGYQSARQLNRSLTEFAADRRPTARTRPTGRDAPPRRSVRGR